mmetsp:Transcript_28644/g.32892  ORF Transcript_28644/g.32892 Transcript_28644/m.32892 type:complete len:422 (-) Transcript_28644:1215-2480(-)
MNIIITSDTEKGIDTSMSTLQLAAKGGMLVKLNVTDGCRIGKVLDIPVKNLLRVNSNKESLSDQASIYIMRHCALSQLRIPLHARDHFYTRFTIKQSGKPVLELTNDTKFTTILEDAATQHMMDDNENVILIVRCELIHQYRWEAEKVRIQATATADNVIKSLKDWITKASRFVSVQSARHPEDYVVVGSHDEKRREKKQNLDDNKPHPMEWTNRLVQVMLAPPVKERKPSSDATDVKQYKRLYDIKDDDELVDEIFVHVEEALENATIALVKGFTKAAKFISKSIEQHNQKRITLSESDSSKSNSFHLSASSISPSPSVVAASISSSSLSCCDNNKVEEGVEVVFDPSCTEKDGNVSTEWRVFFDDADDNNLINDDNVVMIDIPCEADIISLSSDEVNFEKGASVVSYDDDEASWTMLED